MIHRLFGTGTITQAMRGGLSELTATHATISARVAAAQGQSTTDDFGVELESARAAQEAELHQNMVALADTDLRFEAVSRLLQKSYGDLRTAMRDRG